jgi:outer membrane protein OmpA-like peptidoglycan-associated protein
MGTMNRWKGTTGAALLATAIAGPVWAQESSGDTPASDTDETPPGQECSGQPEVIHFGLGSAKLDSEAKDKLDQLVEALRADDLRLARVEAFADPSGDAEQNLKLSDKRAKAVKAYINKQGIDENRVEVFGRGEIDDRPVSPDPDKRIATVLECRWNDEQAASAGATDTETAAPPAEPAPRAEATPMPEPVPEPAPAPAPVPPAEVSRSGREANKLHPLSRVGLGVTAGGGVIGFNDKLARTLADTGGSWEFRLTLGTRLPIGLDLAYVGSSQDLTVPGLSSNAFLLGNGAEADLRLQWPGTMVRPFVFGGVGWTHYDVQRATATGGLRDSDNVGMVPVGVGLALGLPNGPVLEIRATERFAFDDDLFRGMGATDNGLDNWNVTGRIGAEF